MTDRNRALTPRERIAAAYLKFVRDVESQDIAVAFDVNLGRVSEATTAIFYAAENPHEIRALAKGRDEE